MVVSGLLRRRLRAALRVTRLLAAFRLFAMSWSSLDGVANAWHCTSMSDSTGFNTNRPPGTAAAARKINKSESLLGD